eukprot:746755-Hanusia_phi.AAC.3
MMPFRSHAGMLAVQAGRAAGRRGQAGTMLSAQVERVSHGDGVSGRIRDVRILAVRTSIYGY